MTVSGENFHAEPGGFAADKTAMQVLDRGRLEVAAMCIGIAQAARDAATSRTRTCIIGSAPLSNRLGIR
jgi:alkylation response protein AidB-like acyl-CoA dehydrogenase